MREFSRTERIGRELQRELAVLVRDELKDPRLGMVTIQAVKVVADLSHAKVYFSVLATPSGSLQQTAKLLNGAAGFLRRELGHRMSLRTIPQLNFVYDQSLDQGLHLTTLIDEVVTVEDPDQARS